MKTLLLLWLLPITLLLGDPAVVPNTNTGTSIVPRVVHLSPAESQELASAYATALKANPGLQDLGKSLSEQLHAAIAAGKPPGEDLRKAELAYQQALQAAALKADPNVGMIIDKMVHTPTQ